MTRIGRMTTILLALLFLSVGVSLADNRIEVQSVSVAGGESTVVGVYLENDVTIRRLVVPLVVREITPGSYMTAWMPLYNPGGRLMFKLNAAVINNQYPAENGTCKNGSTGGFAGVGAADFVPPDGLLFSRSSLSAFDDLPAGTDFPTGSHEPSMTIALTPAFEPGTFEVDTTCADPFNHLLYEPSAGGIVVPAFTKGVVTIVPDECPTIVRFDTDTVVGLPGLTMTNATVATDGESPPEEIEYCLVSGPGELEPITGDWSYTPDCDDVGEFEVTVGAGDNWHQCACSQKTFRVIVQTATGQDCTDRVIVESKIVPANATTAVRIFLENRRPLRSFTIPLAVREMTPGSYMTAWTCAFNPAARLNGYLETSLIKEYPSEDGSCGTGALAGFGTPGSADFVSPDAVWFHRITFAADKFLPIGSDMTSGTPSITIQIKVTGTPGTFEIDSTCTNPFFHLSFLYYPAVSVIPDFSKGVITIVPCACPYPDDFDEDGFLTALDLSAMIDILFAGQPDVQDPVCPNPRADFDCDGFSTALDLSGLIDHLFAGGNGPCDPCAP